MIPSLLIGQLHHGIELETEESQHCPGAKREAGRQGGWEAGRLGGGASFYRLIQSESVLRVESLLPALASNRVTCSHSKRLNRL